MRQALSHSRRHNLPEKIYQEAPLDRFRQRALLLAARLHFDPGLVNEAIAVLVNSFGEDWMVSKADSTLRGVPLPFRDHPIGGMVHTPGEIQVLEALELATYLKAAARSESFSAIIAGLKAHYRSTLLQMAFAYRVGRMTGVAPALEPSAEDGRLGDMEFTFAGQAYLVECYAPGTRSRALDEVLWLAFKAMSVVEDKRGTFSVAIQVLQLPKAQERKDLQTRIALAVRELDAIAWDGTGWPPSTLLETQVARVSVARTLASEPGQPANLVTHPAFPSLRDPDQFVVMKRVPKSEINRLELETLPTRSRDHVAVWLPQGHYGLPDYVDDEVLKLIPKLKSKLPQTRSPDRHRILIVDTWTALGRYRISSTTEERVRGALFREHRDVSGVLMVTRRFDKTVQRHRYDLRPFLNQDVGAKPIEGLVKQETEMLIPA